MSIKKYRDALLALALLVLAILVSSSGKIGFTEFQYTDGSSPASAVVLPFSAVSPNENGQYLVSGKLLLDSFSPRSLRIIPDDSLLSIEVNGQPVDLSAIPPAALNDWNHGFSINLSQYLHSGENTLRINLGDHGGRFGLKIQPSIEDFRGILPILLWICAISLAMVAIARRAGLTAWYFLAIIAGVALRLCYLAATNYETRTHDVAAHLEYINHFVHNWALPPLDAAQGGAYFHPPFYYFIAAQFQKLISLFVQGDMQFIHLALQWLSTATSLGFLLFGLLIIQQVSTLVRHPHDSPVASGLKQCAFAFAGVLFACWPSSILHGIRISNDAFLYLFFAGGMYYLMRWHESRRWRDLGLTLLFTGLATAAKANGIVLLPATACVVFVVWSEARFRISPTALKKGTLLLMPAIIGAAVAFYPGVALKMEGKRTHTYVSNINNVGADQIVGNELQNLLWFDVKIFVTEPFTSPWDDKMGRQYFGNYLGKTGLFGEWRFNGGLARNSAVMISISFLILSALMLYGFYRMPRSTWLKLSPLIFTGTLLLVAISHMRMSFPVNIDFRYILPIIICYSSFSAATFSVFIDTGRNRLAIINTLAQLAFLVSTVIFFCGVIGAN